MKNLVYFIIILLIPMLGCKSELPLENNSQVAKSDELAVGPELREEIQDPPLELHRGQGHAAPPLARPEAPGSLRLYRNTKCLRPRGIIAVRDGSDAATGLVQDGRADRTRCGLRGIAFRL